MPSRSTIFAVVCGLLFGIEPASRAATGEDEVRRLMEQLRIEARGAEEQRISGLHGSFLNPSTTDDRRFVSLALGVHYLQSNHRLALQYLSSAELASQENDPLLPIVRYYAAEAHFKGGAYRQAADMAQGMLQHDLGQAWGRRVSALLLESLHAVGDHARMASAFHELSKRFGAGRREEHIARLAAEAFEKQGDVKSTVEVLEDLARSYPTTEGSRWALTKLHDYSCARAGMKPRYTFSRRLLLGFSRNTTVDDGLRDFLVAMADQPMALDRGEVRKLNASERADYLFRARLYPEALAATLDIHAKEEARGNSRTLPQITVEVGRIYQRLQEPMLAARWFSKFLVDHPNHALTTRVQELLGDSLRYLGLPLLAAENYNSASGARGTAYLKWQRFWNTYRGGDLKGALRLVETAGAVVPRDGDDPQTVQYWHGRILERLGRKSDAMGVYRSLLARGGDGYYADLVASRYPSLAESTAAAPVPAASADGAGRGLAARILDTEDIDSPTRPELKLVDDLMRVGMKDTATVLLSGLKWNQYSQLDAFAAVSRMALVLDDYAPSRRIRYSTFSSLRLMPSAFRDYVEHQVRHSDDWKIYYPLAFDHLVGPITQRVGLDKFLLLSIMRTESFYNKDARSPVGAMGLLQIMPYTGLKIAQLLDDNSFDVLSLPEPRTNITYGAYYLNRLLRHYGGNPYVAAAAYNGGPTAVSQWLDSCAGCESDEFVESIAFRETRRYVRKVMSSYAQYARIYGGRRTLPELPKLPTHLPEGEEMF